MTRKMAAHRVTHLLTVRDPPSTACRAISPLATADENAVTCRSCLKVIARRNRSAALPRAPVPTFYSKIAGVSHRNDDGTSRQRIIAKCHVGEGLILVRQPDNKHDGNAVRVLGQSGEQLGYLDARVAAQMAGYLDAGDEVPCCITNLTGGGEYTRGVNIYSGEWAAPGERVWNGDSGGSLGPGLAILCILAFVGLIIYIVASTR